jgi:hypothetical protein
MKVTIAVFAVAAILATSVLMTTTTQQALADRVGPLGEDRITQGGLGEFYSREGRDTWFGGVSGQQFGGVRSDIASSDF